MDFCSGMQKALDYIEEHITEELDYEELAAQACFSCFQFQRIFGILSGHTLGGYIRNRRLTLAGTELAAGKLRVIDAAVKYGYDSPDSFTRAFVKFHGITPSAARKPGAKLNSFARLSIKLTLEGGNMLQYRIEEKPEIMLTGYRQRFEGVPYGEAREKQEERFFTGTRVKQWILQGAAVGEDKGLNWCVVTNMGDDGYDFFCGNRLSGFWRNNLRNPQFTGVDDMERFGFEELVLPKTVYAVFETEQSPSPVYGYMDIRRRIVSEWLPASGCRLADAPEVAVYHWYGKPDRERRFIEIWVPVVKK